MANPIEFEEFKVSLDDPLAAEHAAVTAWVEEALASVGGHYYYQDVDLKSLPSGKILLDAQPEQARRYVLAAVKQVRHWDQKAGRVRSQATTDSEQMNSRCPGWRPIWGRRRQSEAAISALMRRALPLEKEDLLAILQWCNDCGDLSTYLAPIGHITRALQRYAAKSPLESDLCDAIKCFASRLRSCNDKDAKKYSTAVELLCNGTDEPVAGDIPMAEIKPPPQPALAGAPAVLDQLKRYLGMLPDESAPTATVVEPDNFALRDDSPLRREHEMVTAVLNEVVGTPNYSSPNLKKISVGQRLLAVEPEAMGMALLASAERHVHALLASKTNLNEQHVWQSHYAIVGIVASLVHAQFILQRDGLFDLLLYLAMRPPHARLMNEKMMADLFSQIESEAKKSPLTEGERYVLGLFRASLISGTPLGLPSAEVLRLSKLIGDGAGFFLAPDEVWSDAVNDDLSKEQATRQQSWIALLKHAVTATAARPSAKWLKTAEKLVEAIGGQDVCDALLRWLPLVADGQSRRRLGSYSGDVRGASDVMNEENSTCLRGLIWTVQSLPCQEALARTITSVALSAYKKVPGVGPRAVKVGNAAVYVLSEMGSTAAIGQLAMLKVRIKFGTAQKEIEKAFNKAAEALQLPRDQIEEMGVPSYGLEDIGLRSEKIGDYRADLRVNGSRAEIAWHDSHGKPLKSVPAKVKSEHKEDLKELQQSLKDIQAMLPAQCDRIDSMFLMQKSWPIETWRERYLLHPLIGTIAQRLLWCIDGTSAMFVEGKPIDVHGEPLAHGKTAEISLWHPIGRDVREIMAWRQGLEEKKIVQPFKQAHREVYLLTDAERNTRTYSNRFAAHILRQHQFNALCAARGWKNRLRLMVDDAYPPATKQLPAWDLRAEFWIEGIGQDYGTDTNESGVYLRLATDQVRFYRTEASVNFAHATGGGYDSSAAGPGQDNINEPLPLEQIPPLVLSEIMRDVDLFVGVASVGNDPAWQDGGPEGRYRAYWQSYSFGELSGTATTRKQVLERLVPRLKIATQCSLSDRFLVVQGKKRTYKIHLGSGNILMEPNDQYLCIVPDSRSQTKQDDLFLPFEGDNTLSIIISKAFLLAEDEKIKDPTILRQIEVA